jgi:addiction module RelE/StbE family toxin
MKYKVIFLPQTVKDRDEIRTYLSQFYPGTSKRFFALLKKKISGLKMYPHSCPVYGDDPDYRKLVVGDYLVFYMVEDAAKIVAIHSILHGSRDIRQHL